MVENDQNIKKVVKFYHFYFMSTVLSEMKKLYKIYMDEKRNIYLGGITGSTSLLLKVHFKLLCLKGRQIWICSFTFLGFNSCQKWDLF